MLFVETKTLKHPAAEPERIRLLEKLQDKSRTGLIRAARLDFFERLLPGLDRANDLEGALLDLAATERSQVFVQGDLFSLNDHVLFLVFDQNFGAIRAGIVYDPKTPEPFRKLDAFCHDIRELLHEENTAGDTEDAGRPADWEQGKPLMPEGFKRFVARQDNDSLYTSLRKDTMTKRILAASRLEDENARVFLRSAREAHLEGYAAKLLPGASSASNEFSIERLEDVGLVEREVQVSCRKTGHALLRLPNANALVVVTVSDATCSECGAPVADEKVEEVIAPTRLASSLLEDGSWLVNRLHSLLREMGVPESEIAVGPSEGDGYGQMMANICGESFLLVARDGDLTPSFARWAIDLEIETEASHLVVVATGRVHNQARLLLLNHSRRRVVAGRDFELVVADGPAAAGVELRRAFDRVSERVVAEQVCDLDNTAGLNLSHLIRKKFEFLRSSEAASTQIPVTEKSSPPPETETRPLALAASASTDQVFEVDELLSDEPLAAEPPVDNIESQLSSDIHAS